MTHPTRQTGSSIASFQSFLEHTWAVWAEFRGEEERREERKVRSSEDRRSPVTQLPSFPQWRARVLRGYGPQGVPTYSDAEIDGRMERWTSGYHQRQAFILRVPAPVHPPGGSPFPLTDPERGPRAAASAGWEGSPEQGGCDQDAWPHPPHSAAGIAGHGSSALWGTQGGFS